MPNNQTSSVVETSIDVTNFTFHDFKNLTLDNGTKFTGH
ncbi:hypothetical protein BTN49_1751 [Candidatus Enterovibrio escicola]|uniref:Uncharacterized protein n=1 Tax=Candidatus Enterovibrio escicola TaxID=1927127 RepID=A0A2A5T328_9GAMM|nr:hypothetical protein BTN49_1751 [Candidatus Enterovibrio escacola]